MTAEVERFDAHTLRVQGMVEAYKRGKPLTTNTLLQIKAMCRKALKVDGFDDFCRIDVRIDHAARTLTLEWVLLKEVAHA